MTTIQELKQGARKTWAEGNYQSIAQFLPPAAAHLVRAAGVKPGDAVLDVACGTGITAITAARIGASVTAIDLTPELLAVAEGEAALAGCSEITWREADAENLPFPDASFDAVLSSFGHMFTPDPIACAAELVRVAKPGATIAFTTWPPGSAVGKMLKAVGAVLPPPAGASPPPQWGVEANVIERLGNGVKDVRFETGTVAWPTLSPGHLWQLFHTQYGPFVAALGKLADEPGKQQQLADGVQTVFAEYFDANVVSFDYLLSRATKI